MAVIARYSAEATNHILNAMAASGMSDGAISKVLGEPVGFVRSGRGGKQLLRASHARRIERLTGTSAGRWGMRGLDRSGLAPATAKFLSDSERLIEQMDAFVNQGKKRRTTSGRRPAKAIR